ncbi:MAG TPA: M1 family aminopeptidase [Thermoanaerobaculia bacterium]|nr:M1 family aminopeptidase [Thermoanaerobaculia bacterium]
MKPARSLFLALLFLTTSLSAATVRLGNDVLPTAQSVQLTVDPRKDDYTGSVTVDLDVKKATASFLMHSEDMTITSLKIDGADATHAKGEDGTITITAAAPLKPGKHTLTAAFTNKFNRRAVGLYKMMTKDGEPYLFTQFQAIDARRAFPVFDEPRFKIPYEINVSIPEQYEAISNASIAAESKADGAKNIRFAKTKPLPSYLVALAVGQFESTPITGMSVPGRIIAPKGQLQLTKYAAQITPGILAALEKYFGSKHPFEKVDVIGVPEYWAGAMENPGLITFRDTILLLDSNVATPNQRQSVIRIMAHELAHMWFGDLVTMEWWDDLWLNESFADWMGDKITDQLYPEFGHLVGELRGIQRVMTADARTTTDPIRKLDIDPEQAMGNVGIAYDKGKAVIQMFESWIGPEKFRQGVLDHLKANQWGNANAAEFFAAFEKHAPKGTVAAMESFINQPGVPLITVEQTGPNEVRVTQSRFSTGNAAAQTWRVPVMMRYSDGKTVRTASVLLDTPSKTVKLEGDRVDWLYPSGNAAGYYRWRLPEAQMTALASRATSVLEPKERLAFIGNAGGLFSNGTIHGDTYLDLLARFSSDPDPHVFSAMMGALATVRNTFESAETRPKFAQYLRRTLSPALDRIGFAPKAGEPATITQVRPEVLAMLGYYADDERVSQWAREALPKYLADPSTVHPTLAGLVLGMSADQGDEALFEDFRKRFETASLPADRARFLNALGSFEKPALVAKAREYALNGPVRPNELFSLIGGGDTPEERDEFFNWFMANFDPIMKKLPPAFAAGLPAVAGGCEPARVAKAKQFFAEKKVPGTERRLAQVEEQVNDCAALRSREMAAVSRFLAGAPQ